MSLQEITTKNISLREITKKNMESIGIVATDFPYLLDIDYERQHKLKTYYESKIKQNYVIEYQFVEVTDKFGADYHHYLPDYTKIHPKYHKYIPPVFYVPDRKYFPKPLSKYPTSFYFGEYLWCPNKDWDILYKENEKLFLILK